MLDRDRSSYIHKTECACVFIQCPEAKNNPDSHVTSLPLYTATHLNGYCTSERLDETETLPLYDQYANYNMCTILICWIVALTQLN